MTWALILLYASSIGVDGYTTQHIKNFREYDPLARPFVHSAKGQALGSAIGFSVGVVPTYFLHRHHRKLAMAWLGTATMLEAANSARMVNEYRKFHD